MLKRICLGVAALCLAGSLAARGGEAIGYWYSIRNPTDIGSIRMAEGNVVHITTPRGQGGVKKAGRDSD